jgi:hypothetical protein
MRHNNYKTNLIRRKSNINKSTYIGKLIRQSGGKYSH